MKGKMILHGLQTEKLMFSGSDFSYDFVMTPKFVSDKIHKETEDYIFVFDGIVLNRLEVHQGNWEDFFLKNPQSLAQKLNLLKGNFCGFIFDKRTQKLTLFNDSFGAKNFSYYWANHQFCFADSVMDLLKMDIPKKWDALSIYSFLAYGYLFSELAWVENAKRMMPGTILEFHRGKISELRYKKFRLNENKNLNKKQIISSIEELLTRNVQLQFEKDKSNGYEHFVTLSGGLDSRVTSLMAYDLGYKKQTVFNCSQQQYADEIIARQIADAYDFDFKFYALDKTEYLYTPQEMMQRMGGTTVYNAAAHVIYGIDSFWKNDFGIVHTGHLGGNVFGSYLSKNQIVPFSFDSGRVSRQLLPTHRQFEEIYSNKHPNEEIFKIYERGFHYIASGVWGLDAISYNISPFVSTDFLDFSLSIPYRFKYKNIVYLEWLNHYHKDWTRFKWEHLHARPNKLWKRKYDKQYLRLKLGWKKLFLKDFRAKFNMTPEQYWFEKNSDLQQFMTAQTHQAMKIIQSHDIPYLETVMAMADSSRIEDKIKVISLAQVLSV